MEVEFFEFFLIINPLDLNVNIEQTGRSMNTLRCSTSGRNTGEQREERRGRKPH